MENQSDLYVEFLKEHPLISIRGLETELGTYKGVIGHALTENSTRKIPEKYWYDLGLILCKYGFRFPDIEEFIEEDIEDSITGKLGGLSIGKREDKITIQDLASGEYFEVKELEVEIMLRKLF